MLGEHWTTKLYSGFTKLFYTGTHLCRSRLTSSTTKLAPLGVLRPGELGSGCVMPHRQGITTKYMELSLTGPEEERGTTVG